MVNGKLCFSSIQNSLIACFQRYISNDQFFREDGPIFIYLGGEWTISQSSLMRGQMFDMASEHNGYMFYTEHRFYGESFPTEYSLHYFPSNHE